MKSRRGSCPPWILASLVLVAGLIGCRGTEIEDAIDNVDWFSNMKEQAAVEPFEEPARIPPEGTVHVGAGVALGALPDEYDAVPNPLAATPESLERGKELYDIYCTVCHGPQGQGDGNIEGPFPRGLINMLTTERARGYTDGYIFGMMSAGRGLMPNYRRMPQEERWHVVNYVRRLQQQAQSGN